MLSGASLVFQSFGFNSLRQDTGFRYSVLAFGGIADEPGSLGEEFPHLLQGQLFSFREHGPEEDGIGEIADLDTECQLPVKVSQVSWDARERSRRYLMDAHHEQDVEFPSRVCHSNGCHLTDHCAERKMSY
jgi:hypothetical protein